MAGEGRGCRDNRVTSQKGTEVEPHGRSRCDSGDRAEQNLKNGSELCGGAAQPGHMTCWCLSLILITHSAHEVLVPVVVLVRLGGEYFRIIIQVIVW